MARNKFFYVAWETRMQAGLDDLALQGPHSREDAERLRDSLHSAGLKASVIASPSLEQVQAFHDWVRAFIGEDAYREINHPIATRFFETFGKEVSRPR